MATCNLPFPNPLQVFPFKYECGRVPSERQGQLLHQGEGGKYHQEESET
jgi:hypothetical protein